MKTFKKFRIELEESMLGTLGKYAYNGGLAMDAISGFKKDPAGSVLNVIGMLPKVGIPFSLLTQSNDLNPYDETPTINKNEKTGETTVSFKASDDGTDKYTYTVPSSTWKSPDSKSKSDEQKPKTIVTNNPAGSTSNTAPVTTGNATPNPIPKPEQPKPITKPEQPKPITSPQIPTNQQTPNKIKMSSIKGYESKKGYFVPQHWKQDETSGKWKSTVKGSTTQLSDAEYKKLSVIPPSKLK